MRSFGPYRFTTPTIFLTRCLPIEWRTFDLMTQVHLDVADLRKYNHRQQAVPVIKRIMEELFGGEGH
jgi:hypothetical protein